MNAKLKALCKHPELFTLKMLKAMVCRRCGQQWLHERTRCGTRWIRKR